MHGKLFHPADILKKPKKTGRLALQALPALRRTSVYSQNYRL
jgi:hypothetical protein